MSFTVFRYKILEKNTGHCPGDSWKRPALILDIDIAHYVLDEDTIQILKYSLWDVERSILEMPASWRYLYLEEKGSLPADDEAIARKIYDFAVKKKLERVKEFGIDLTGVYERIRKR